MAIRRTARIGTGALEGIDGVSVTAEVDISRGLPGFHLVGLPNAEVRESKERVLSALRNSGHKIPLGKITVNLAPAGMRKTGAAADLAVAMGILAAGGGIRLGPSVRTGAAFLGELSLFGEVRSVRGLLAMVLGAAEAGYATAVVPLEQLTEARLVPDINIVGVRDLRQAVTWWEGGEVSQHVAQKKSQKVEFPASPKSLWPDLKGQPLVRKAAVLTACGGHHLLMVGPPGSGKTRLARSLAEVGAPLSFLCALEVMRIHSVVGTTNGGRLPVQRPFRAPHHTITRAGLVGGGANLRPGEVTLAHEGVLFLDELSEFAPAVLDGLREPLADGQVSMVRGTGARIYPAQFQLLAAMNPCRCGYLGSVLRECRCTPAEINRYQGRLSGPLLDRIEIFVEVGAWQGDFLQNQQQESVKGSRPVGDWRESPTTLDLERAQKKLKARDRTGSYEMLTTAAKKYLDQVRVPMGLSLRGVDRCVAVAETVAALDGSDTISPAQIRDAIEFRRETTMTSRQ